MNSVLHTSLNTSAPQTARLHELQQVFAKVCNALAPLVQQTACWNRVALHHMAYKQLRQQFPDLGSQMVCNAIYSVSRTCRVVYQHPNSPFNVQRLAGRPLPLVKFLPQSPVYFDRHTLSLKDGLVSMFTLDGRMRFELALSKADERRFRDEKLREIVLTSRAEVFSLSFTFARPDDAAQADEAPAAGRRANPHSSGRLAGMDQSSLHAELPEYVIVSDDEAVAALPHPPAAVQAAQLPT